MATWPDVILVEAGFSSGGPGLPGSSLILDDATNGKLDTATLGPGVVWTSLNGYLPDGTAIVQSLQITRSSTRQLGPLVSYQAGTCTVTLANSDARFSPENLAGPYVSGGVTQVAPMVPIRVRVTWAGVIYTLFTGYVRSWVAPTAQNGPDYDYIVADAQDGMCVLEGVTIPASGSVGAGELTGARVKRILTAAGWYSLAQGFSDIDTGRSAVQATTMGDTALSLLQLTADSEVGEVYVSGSGKLVFRDRYAPLNDARSNTVQAVFTDTPSGTGYDTLVAAAAPLGWWKLADPAGSATAADSSGNSHPATATGMAFGNASHAVAGNSSASLLASNVPQILTSYNPAAVAAAECWVNLNSQAQTGNSRLVNNSHTDVDNNGFQLWLNGSQPAFTVGKGSGNASAFSSVNVPASGWTHIAGTYDGATVRIYVNGAQTGTAAFTGSVTAGSASGISLGYAAAYNGDYLSGLLAECAVYGAASSAADIAARVAAAPVMAGLPYVEISRPDDDTTLANDIQAAITGSSNMQEAKDAASIARFLFARSYSRSDLILQGDPDALSWAQYVLALSRNDESRFDSLTIQADSDPADLFPQVLGREIGDRIQVWRDPPGMTAFSRDCFISGISHDISVDGWVTVWGLRSAAKYGSVFTLDNGTLGQLDSNSLAF